MGILEALVKPAKAYEYTSMPERDDIVRVWSPGSIFHGSVGSAEQVWGDKLEINIMGCVVVVEAHQVELISRGMR